MAKDRRTTPGLADIEMTMEVLKKRKAKKRRAEYLKSIGKGGKSDESNSEPQY